MHSMAEALILRGLEWANTAAVAACVAMSVRTLSLWIGTLRGVCQGDSSPGCLWVRRKLRTEWCILIVQALTFGVTLWRTVGSTFSTVRGTPVFTAFGLIRTLSAVLLAWCVWANRRSYEQLGESEQ